MQSGGSSAVSSRAAILAVSRALELTACIQGTAKVARAGVPRAGMLARGGARACGTWAKAGPKACGAGLMAGPAVARKAGMAAKDANRRLTVSERSLFIASRFSFACRIRWQRQGLQEFRKGRAAPLQMFRLVYGPRSAVLTEVGRQGTLKRRRCNIRLASGMEMDGAKVGKIESTSVVWCRRWCQRCRSKPQLSRGSGVQALDSRSGVGLRDSGGEGQVRYHRSRV